MSRLSLIFVALLLASTAQAQNSTGYTSANPQGCKVWVPLQLHGPDYVPHYTGACSKDLAQGKGELRWMYSNPSNTRPKATWSGFFQDGVYVGAAPLPHLIEPQPQSNDYLVHVGATGSADVLVVAQASNEGVMDLCAPSFIYVSLNSKVVPTDDTAVKQAMVDAGAKLQASSCPAMRHPLTQINVYAQPYKLNPDGTRPLEVADSNLNWSTMTLVGYSNRASSELRNKQNVVQRDTRLAASHKRFDDFTTRNHIASWVTTKQLDENPFKFEGQTVGVIVQLDRMLSPDTALVTSGRNEYGSSIQLHGITPDFPDHTHAVILAAKVGKREPLVGSSAQQATTTSITRLDSATCARDSCYDWLDWTVRGATNRIPWGEPYTPAP